MKAAIAELPNRDMKDSRKCLPHMMFNIEACKRKRKLIESKVVLYKDASRSEQCVVVWFLIAGGKFNVDIYQRTVTVYGEHRLGRTSWNR
ncbi:hypothetical protein TNCV_2880671 [Trichonephila clavipes]|nr:hypothetical protein TNCV_2880671 [Trichonephila clavipes]